MKVSKTAVALAHAVGFWRLCPGCHCFPYDGSGLAGWRWHVHTADNQRPLRTLYACSRCGVRWRPHTDSLTRRPQVFFERGP